MISFIFSIIVILSFNPQEDERYEQVSEVRAQLKFFEQLDQMEKQRKEEQEREILLKAAKVTILKKDTLYHRQEEPHVIAQRRRVSDLGSASLE